MRGAPAPWLKREDLQGLFCIGGSVPETNYFFTWDYVDRGHFSVKVVTIMFLIKARYKEKNFAPSREPCESVDH